MKYGDGFPVSKDCGRSPCGERGLKFSLLHKSHDSAVAPRAGSVD